MSHSLKRFDGLIPFKRIVVEACRSSGPGGQNVNKRDTKVSVSFKLAEADWLPEETRSKLAELHKSKISKEGIFRIRSDKTRHQTLNIADCLDRLRSYISEAEQPPPQEAMLETLEIKRKILERASAERLRSKRIESMKRNNMSRDIW